MCSLVLASRVGIALARFIIHIS